MLFSGTATQKTTSAPFEARIAARAALSTLTSSIFLFMRLEISAKTAVLNPAGVPSAKIISKGGKSPVTANLIVSAPSIFFHAKFPYRWNVATCNLRHSDELRAFDLI